MKKLIIPAFLTLTIGILGFVNYVYPLVSIFSQENYLDFDRFRYFFVIASYVCIILTVWIEKENLASWNLDRLSVFVLVLVSVVRANLHVPNEGYYKIFIAIVGLFLLLVSAMNWKNIPQTNSHWAIVGLLSCFLVIPLAFVESQMTEKYADASALYQTNFFSYAARNFLYTVSFVAPFEEVIIRGVFWGQLRKWNMTDTRIVWIQGVVFWLLHFWQIVTPITFFVTIPLQILILSLLVKYSRQLFPSFISHTVINVLGPIVISFFFES